jgi:hypothetical protein
MSEANTALAPVAPEQETCRECGIYSQSGNFARGACERQGLIACIHADLFVRAKMRIDANRVECSRNDVYRCHDSMSTPTVHNAKNAHRDSAGHASAKRNFRPGAALAC